MTQAFYSILLVILPSQWQSSKTRKTRSSVSALSASRLLVSAPSLSAASTSIAWSASMGGLSMWMRARFARWLSSSSRSSTLYSPRRLASFLMYPSPRNPTQMQTSSMIAILQKFATFASLSARLRRKSWCSCATIATLTLLITRAWKWIRYQKVTGSATIACRRELKCNV